MKNIYELALKALKCETELKEIQSNDSNYYKKLEERNNFLNQIVSLLNEKGFSKLPMLSVHQKNGRYVYEEIKNHLKLSFHYEYYLDLIKEKDTVTYLHSINVGTLMRDFALYLNMNNILAEQYLIAGYLHDIGKIYIPNKILNKPGKLNDVERSIIEKHPSLGVNIITEAIPTTIRNVIEGHHLSYNGKNSYPASFLRGINIPLEARICTICDIYEALTAKRPYKEGMSKEEAILIMETMTNLDPELFRSFVSMLKKRNIAVA